MSGTRDWRALSFFPSPARSTRLNRDMGASVLAPSTYPSPPSERAAGHHVHVVGQVHGDPPGAGNDPPEEICDRSSRAGGGRHLAEEVIGRHDVGVEADPLDREPGLG